MAKTYTVGAETAWMFDELRRRLTTRSGFEPTNAQVLRHAVRIALAQTNEPASEADAKGEC